MARGRLLGLGCVALASGLALPAAHALPYGVNAHIPSAEMMRVAAAAGIEWVRIDVNWNAVERSPGTYDWGAYDRLVDAAEASGIKVFATLAYTPAWATQGPEVSGVPSDPQTWYTFCFRAAQRYRGRIDHFGMWNEPNLSKFWAGSRTQYIETILKIGSRAVHDANPRARVCGPELAHLESANWDGWLSEVLSRAGDYLDVVTHHVYPGGDDPDAVIRALNRDQQHSWEPRSVKEVIRKGGWQKLPFWLTETGLDSRSPSEAGEATQALFVSGLLSQLFGPTRSVSWVQKVFFYELNDDPNNPGNTFGLVGLPPEYREKAALDAYSRFADQAAVDDAEVVSASVPAVLRPGEQVVARVTFRNAGTTTWSPEAGYYVGPLAGSDTFGAARQPLGSGERVPPGGITTFTIGFLAPAVVAGDTETFVTRWQMARNGLPGFGEVKAQTVAVTTSDVLQKIMYLPAMANSAGLNGTRWHSDIAVFNAGPETAELSIAALEQGRDNSSPRAVRLVLAPGTQQRINDVIATQFGVAGAVTLRLDVARGNVAAMGRSYTQQGSGSCGKGIPALPASSAVRFGGAARLVGLAYSEDRGTGSRTNLGMVNPGSQPIAVEVELFAEDAASLGTLTFELPAFGFRQVTDVYRAVGAPMVTNGTATVRTLTMGTAVLAYASVVDNRSGEPMLIAPAAPADEPLVIVTAAHNAGLLDSLWRSDLGLFNAGPETATFAVELLAPGSAARPPAAPLTLAASSSVLLADVVGTLFGLDGAGALRITPGAGGAVVFSTTYNAGSVGRLGQGVPAALQSDAAVFGQEVRLLQLSGSQDRSRGYRSNVGFVNVSGLTITVEVELFRSPAVPVGTLTATLAPLEWRQITDVFRVAASDVDDGFAVVRTTTPGGRFISYASVIDNVSGDPILVQGW